MLTNYVWQQAEDVLGSLLKEYLNVPNEQVNVPSTSGTSMEEVSEGCVRHETENGEQASLSSENDKQEDETKVQKGSESENGNTLVQQFKNVVAIVDPPRAGLHPTVRIILSIISSLHINLNVSEINICLPKLAPVELGGQLFEISITSQFSYSLL